MRAHGRRVLGMVAATAMALGALVGSGTAAGAADGPGDVDFAVNPSAGLDFGTQQLGHESEEQHFDVVVPPGWTLDDIDTQAGTGNLDDWQLDIPSFHECDPGPTSCAIGYSFVPSRVGAESATALFEFLKNGTSDVYERISRPLAGAGALEDPGTSGFSVSPGTLSFGDQPVGTTSAPKTVTVEVPAGYSLGDFGIGGDDVGDFDFDGTQVQACENTPGPTQCVIGVTFTPGGTGSRSAEATLDIGPTPGGGTSASKTIKFEGKGVSPGVGGSEGSVTPTTLDFGDVPVGAQPPAISYVTLNVPAGFEFVSEGVGGGGGQFHADDASFDACWQKPGPLACHLGFTFSPGGTGVQTATANVDIAPVGGGDTQDFLVTLARHGCPSARRRRVLGLADDGELRQRAVGPDPTPLRDGDAERPGGPRARRLRHRWPR